MINFNHSKGCSHSIKLAFNISDKDRIHFNKYINPYIYKRSLPVTVIVERIWIDEVLSDNSKAYLLFSLGRLFEQSLYEDDEDDDLEDYDNSIDL